MFSDFSACSSDTSVELERIATVFSSEPAVDGERQPESEPEPCFGFTQWESFSDNLDYLAGEFSAAGAVMQLVELVAEEGSGIGDKAMVLLNSLAGIEEGKEAIVEEGGTAALVEAIEDGICCKSKLFATPFPYPVL